MTLKERKEDLLNYSAIEVRNNRALFAEFVFIYKEEGGRLNCYSCAFGSIFNKWKKENLTPKKIKQMSNNTFKMKNPKEMIPVPFSGDVITKDSPDEMVERFLSQEKGKFRKQRVERFFQAEPQPKKKVARKKKVAKKPEVKKD